MLKIITKTYLDAYKKGNEYKALDPLTNNVYSAKTIDEAMGQLASNFQAVNGEVCFADKNGQAVSYDVSMKEDTFWNDLAMGTVGAVGGLLLILPEPTMASKVGGVACVSVSSAYFLNKGVNSLVEQISHENFDISRPESRAAIMDIASGLLAIAGAATSTALTMNTSLHAARTTTTVAKWSTTAVKVGNSFMYSANGSQVLMDIVNIYNDNNLSDSEKSAAIGKALLAFAPSQTIYIK